MKKLAVMIIFCMTAVAGGWSQDWSVIEPGRLYNYSLDSIISTTIWVDSTYVENGKSYYRLNTVSSVCDVCEKKDNAAIVYLKNQPGFLQREIVKTDEGVFLLRDTARYVIKPFADLNDSWVFDSVHQITATCVSKEFCSVFPGMEDSVRICTLNQQDTLILSQHVGIVKFPDFKGHHYRLLGIEGNTSAGKKNLRFEDIINPAVGDVFEYSLTSGARFTGPWDLQKHTVSGVQKFQDSILVHTHKLSRKIHYNYYSPYDTTYVSSETILRYYRANLWFLDAYNFQDITNTNPVYVSYDRDFKCLKKSYCSNGTYSLGDTVYSTYNPHFQDMYTDYSFGEQIGLINVYTASNRFGPYFSWEKKELLGYRHQGVTYGQIDDDRLFQPPVQDTTVPITSSVYPTFFRDEIHLYCIDCVGQTMIRIFDLTGNLRYEREVFDMVRTTLYPDGLEKGIYLLEIRKQHVKTEKCKIVKR